jgi:uncharacterized membrane protein
MVWGSGQISAAEKMDESDDNAQPVALKDLPGSVSATAKAQVTGGKLVKAEIEDEDGMRVYSIDAKTSAGEELEIVVTTDGKLVKVEKEDDDEKGKKDEADEEDDNAQPVELKDLPAAVSATAKAQVQGGELVKAEIEDEDGMRVYSIDAKTSAGEELEIVVTTDGKLVKVEKEDDEEDDNEQPVALKDLPTSVSATAMDQVKGGKLVKAEIEDEDGMRVYSIEAKTSTGEELEIVVATDGKLVKVEKEADEKKGEKDEKEGSKSSHMKNEKHQSDEKSEDHESQETKG